MPPTFTPQDCARRWREARRVGVLTGAGLSTAAGVPDFRGPRGLYVTRAYDPETVFDIMYFTGHPEPFFAFSRDFLTLLDGLGPTFTHRFLAEREKEGKLAGVVTQNIDGLHRAAGSRLVLPMHGDYETASCMKCGRTFGLAEYRPTVAKGSVPRCGAVVGRSGGETGGESDSGGTELPCDGVIKPDVVFFGEAVLCHREAVSLAASCDFFMALGTSLAVYPAAAVPEACPGDVWVVNRGDVPLRPGWRHADADLDEFFREMEKFRV